MRFEVRRLLNASAGKAFPHYYLLFEVRGAPPIGKDAKGDESLTIFVPGLARWSPLPSSPFPLYVFLFLFPLWPLLSTHA